MKSNFSREVSNDPKWKKIPNDELIEKTVQALKENGMDATVVQNRDEAKKRVLEIVPKGAQVMTMTSITLEEIGVLPQINESGEYDSVRQKLNSMQRETSGREMQRLGASPEWAVGSVHAITGDGEVIVASNTGSQLPAYAYGSDHVLWVVGAQKIVETFDEAIERLYAYTLPLEDRRANKAYGMPHSNVSKKLIISKEVKAGRIQIVIVKEVLGF